MAKKAGLATNRKSNWLVFLTNFFHQSSPAVSLNMPSGTNVTVAYPTVKSCCLFANQTSNCLACNSEVGCTLKIQNTYKSNSRLNFSLGSQKVALPGWVP